MAGRYTIDTAGRIGLEIADYDVTQPLVIDPVLSFSTYRHVGGNATPTGIAVDNSGNICVSYTTFDAADLLENQFVVHKMIAGRTSSPNFPMRNAYQSTYGGGVSDGFLARLDTGGTAILYSTYIGGAMDDDIQPIRIDGTGNVLLGSVTGVVQCRLIQPGRYFPCRNVVVSKMNPGGTAILQSRLRGRVVRHCEGIHRWNLER